MVAVIKSIIYSIFYHREKEKNKKWLVKAYVYVIGHKNQVVLVDMPVVRSAVRYVSYSCDGMDFGALVVVTDYEQDHVISNTRQS
jgi:hypothetical protein